MVYEILQESIDKKEEKFNKVANEIWELSELAYKEFKSSKLQMDLLREEGFTIEERVGKIETAFTAKFGSGKPVIGILGEYDALPYLSQKSDLDEEEAIVKGGAGHGCGHQLLGTGCMQAAVGLKDYLKASGLEGTVIYYGCLQKKVGLERHFYKGKEFLMRQMYALLGIPLILQWVQHQP